MEQCESAHSSDGALPAAVGDAVAAALDDGASVDEIVARVRAGGDDGRGGGWLDGLIGLQREADRLAGEWVQAREPGGEGRAGLVAIETLRALALRTMAGLMQRAEPVAPEDFGRLALTLQRIERADGLRIACERMMAEVGAAGLTHDERAGAIHRHQQEQFFPERTDPPPPDTGWTADGPAASDAIPPNPAPDPPADAGAQAAQDAGRAEHARDAGETRDAQEADAAPAPPDTQGAPDTGDAAAAPDDWDTSVARDIELRRRERERALWPTDPPLCPAAWSEPG